MDDVRVGDAVTAAHSQIPIGASLLHCEKCGNAIPEVRRKAIVGVRFCFICQTKLDKQQAGLSSYNRRGSKESHEVTSHPNKTLKTYQRGVIAD